jgi:CelD/BcsL family acetyltransferase involved in cellulose biosynthesis
MNAPAHDNAGFVPSAALGDGIRVAVVHDLRDFAPEWRAFQGRAAGTFYQTYEWCAAWLATVGEECGASPVIVTGRDCLNRLLFILPFSLRRRGGARVLEWIGARQIGYGYGMFDREFLPGAAEWFETRGWDILRRAAEADAVCLNCMPQRLHGHPHPLTGWFSFQGRNRSYLMALDADYEALYARKRSAETRRGNRKRDAKLRALGEVSFGLPKGIADAKEKLGQMFEQQERRLSEAGIGAVFGAAERAFVDRLADCDEPRLLAYHLSAGGRMEAMMLGGYYDGTYWAMISSLGDGPARRFSPGDLALRLTIEACCKAGLKTFDFSTGDTAYKSHWADDIVPHHETVRAVTARGYPFAAVAAAVELAKRSIKTTPVLWELALWWREWRGRKLA